MGMSKRLKILRVLDGIVLDLKEKEEYDIIKIHEYYAELMTDEPFDYLETSTKFDSINKSIITTSIGGQGSIYTYTYQPKDHETM